MTLFEAITNAVKDGKTVRFARNRFSRTDVLEIEVSRLHNNKMRAETVLFETIVLKIGQSPDDVIANRINQMSEDVSK